jgi:hypothetical protein
MLTGRMLAATTACAAGLTSPAGTVVSEDFSCIALETGFDAGRLPASVRTVFRAPFSIDWTVGKALCTLAAITAAAPLIAALALAEVFADALAEPDGVLDLAAAEEATNPAAMPPVAAVADFATKNLPATGSLLGEAAACWGVAAFAADGAGLLRLSPSAAAGAASDAPFPCPLGNAESLVLAIFGKVDVETVPIERGSAERGRPLRATPLDTALEPFVEEACGFGSNASALFPAPGIADRTGSERLAVGSSEDEFANKPESTASKPSRLPWLFFGASESLRGFCDAAGDRAGRFGKKLAMLFTAPPKAYRCLRASFVPMRSARRLKRLLP